MPTKGYGGGSVRPVRPFHTGLVGDDSTGANIVSKVNQVNERGRQGKREKYNGRGGRWS